MTKLEMLKMLKDKVCQCTKCPELVTSRTQIVFDNINYEEDGQLAKSGNCDAQLMIIGEGPGVNEDLKGLPFVGDAGDLLNNILKACGWSRQDVYIVNTVKCRPPNNREPTDEESRNCRPFLDRQIDLVKPKFLLLLGSVASRALLGGFVSYLRGQWYEYRGIPTLVTFHPAFILRNPEEKKKVGQDLRMLLTRIKS